jgi:putative tryptophan/tyrosine transport system ATP-binding protein
MISLQSLQVTFNAGTPIENHVLRGLTLEIKQGQFVSVIGSNGAGKSTMLNAISGDLLVDTGIIQIDDKDVTRLPAWKRAPWVARVFQDPMAGTCESLTILENMALATGRGGTRVPFRSAVKNSMREFFRDRLRLLNLGLENRLDDRIGLLSLDEHTAALDPKTAAFVLRLTEKIVQEAKLTTMMVTHSMRQALDHGSRTVMLHQGQVVLDVSGDSRSRMSVEDLLHAFERTRGEQIDDDKLLLS